MANRDKSIDIAKGIAIILVVCGHCNLVYGLPRQFIYSFHMPLFFFFAGYFFQPRDMVDTMKKDCKRLIFPYLACCLFMISKFFVTKTLYRGDYMESVNNVIAMVWCGSSGNTCLFFSDIKPIGIVWFLPALFWCKSVYNLIAHHVVSDIGRFVIASFISIASTLVARYVINLPLGLLAGLSALIFFMMGDVYSRLKFRPYMWLLLLLGMGCWFVGIKWSYLLMHNNHYGMYPVDVIGAVFGTLAIWKVSKMIALHFGPAARLLSWFGINSMVIYCCHYVTQIIDPNTRLNTQYWYVWVAIDFAIILPLTFLCTRIGFTRKLFQIK